jgi:hypothetical protein
MLLILEDLLGALLDAKIKALNCVVVVLASKEERRLLGRLVSEASTVDLENVGIVTAQVPKFESQHARVLHFLLQEALSANVAADSAGLFVREEDYAALD